MEFDYGLLAKYLANHITPDEIRKVTDWSNVSQENKKIFMDVIGLRVSFHSMQYKHSGHTEEALKRVNRKINQSNRLRRVRSVLQYAAVLLVLMGGAYGGYKQIKPDKYVSIVTNPGQDVKKIILADGTSVWLKGGSVLKYPESFPVKHRRVFLQGDAFFEVAKRAAGDSLFIVSTGSVHIQVKGTSFEVKVDEETKSVETVLVSGEIALLDVEKNKILDVSPGEKVTYCRNENEYTTEEVDANILTAWRLRQFVFENATLREIVNKLSTKFNVNINLSSSALAQRTFRCVINEEEGLVDILELLSYLAPVAYRIEGTEVFIYEQLKK